MFREKMINVFSLPGHGVYACTTKPLQCYEMNIVGTGNYSQSYLNAYSNNYNKGKVFTLRMITKPSETKSITIVGAWTP